MATILRRAATLGLLLGLAAATAACDAYDPNLGDTPFLCGDGTPACPDGYSQVWVSTTRCECHRGAAADGGGNGFQCNSDRNEPNDDLTTATDTPVGNGASTVTFNGVAICPADDQDVYSILVARAGTQIDATITYDSGVGPLDVQILSSNGTPVADGMSSGVGKQTVTHTTAFAGSYYVRVQGGSPGVENNYSVDIRTQ